MKPIDRHNDARDFSVIVPTRNRPDALGRCLQALVDLDFPRDRFEVVVVDDGGDQGLDDIVKRFESAMRVRLVYQDHAGPAAARNTGAERAAGRFVAFTDDDCLPDPTWLSRLAVALNENPHRMVGGRNVNALDSNVYSTASQDLISYLYEYFNAAGATFFCSNNLAVARDALCDAGGFDSRFTMAAGEDRELCDRWHHGQRPLHYASDAVVKHAHDLDARRFWLQHLRYGRAAAHYHRLYADRRGSDVRVEPLRFYAKLLAHPFSHMPLLRGIVCASLLAVSQVANVMGFLLESRKLRR